jgi:hypothetical protein
MNVSKPWLTVLAGIIGASLLAFLPEKNHVGGLVGLYLIVAIYSITTVIQAWSMANVSGHTKRAGMATMMAAAFGIGMIISPKTFQERDKQTGYLPAKITVMVSQALCALNFFLLRNYYKFENHRRDKNHAAAALEDDTGAEVSAEEAWAGMTDKENKRFRYIY